MKPDLDMAATLECEPELLAYLPELLQDFDELGSDSRRMIECLEAAGAAAEIGSALDLCCGKGAAAVALAGHFGIRVDGVDAMEAFIESAREAAEEAGVGELCRFRVGDLSAAVSEPGSYDLVIFASVGPILGGITRTVTHLMAPLRDGGWLLLDDSVLLAGAPARPGFEAHAELEETRRRIERSGAEIVKICPAETDADGNDSDLRRIERRAADLVERRPDLASQVARYLERQRAEYAYLERWTRDVTWLLRKPPARETCR